MRCLPHVQVDASAFDSLTKCIYEGDFDKCEKVPSGEDGGFLIQPLGGIAIDMAGPARYCCHRFVATCYVRGIYRLQGL